LGLGRRILKLLGIDKAVGYSLAATLASNVLRLVSLVVILAFITLGEQGFFYTIQSLLAAQVFIEMGFGLVLQQSAAAEFGKLQWVDEKITGDERAKARLAALDRIARRWYRAGAVLLLIGLTPVGWWMLAEPGETAGVDWQAAWVLSVLNTALVLAVAPLAQMLNGCGRVDSTAQVNFYVAVAQPPLLWLFLGCGLKLVAFPLAILITTLSAFLVLRRRHRDALKDLRATAADPGYTWRKELWPFQWRIGLSWMAGYFIFQLVVPFAFDRYGPEAAGRIGFTMALSATVTAVGIMWLNTKMPRLGTLAAQCDFLSLDREFRAVLIRSTGVVLLGMAGLVATVLLLQAIASKYADRFLDFPLLLAPVVFGIFNHINACLAGYLRAFKKEPFLILSLLVGLAVVFIVLATRSRPVNVLLFAYAGVSVVSLLYGITIFRKHRKILQLEAPAKTQGEGVLAPC
jgi:hypothetical protein